MKRYEVCSWFIDGLWAGAISLKTAGGAASVGRCCPRTFLAPYPNPYPEPIPRTRTQFTRTPYRTPYRTTARTTARTTVPNSAPNYGSPPSDMDVHVQCAIAHQRRTAANAAQLLVYPQNMNIADTYSVL